MTDKKAEVTKWTVHDYQPPNSRSLIRAFIAALPQEPKAEAIALIKLLEERGNGVRMPHSRALGEGLFELRGLKHGIRIFYMFRPHHHIMLLDGVVKKTQKTSPDVLERLRGLQAEVNQTERKERK